MRLPALPRTSGFLVAAALAELTIGGGATCLTLQLDRDFHATQSQIGLLAAVPTLIYILSTIPLGHLSDRSGVRRMAIGGVALMAAMTALLGRCHSIGPMLPILAGRGLGAAMYWPALSAWLSRGADAASLPRRMAAYNLGWSGGSIFGPALAGLAYAWLGPHRALFAAGGLAALIVPLLLVSPRQVAGGGGLELPPSGAFDRRASWLSSFAAFFQANLVRALLPQYGRRLLDLTPELTGLLLALIALTQTLVFLYLGLIRPHWASGRWLLPTQVGAGLAMLLIAVPNVPLMALAMLLLGLNTGVCYTASLYHSLQGRDDLAKQTGINEAVVGSGGMLGPSLGGLVSDGAGPQAPWVLGLAVVLAVLGARRMKPRGG